MEALCWKYQPFVKLCGAEAVTIQLLVVAVQTSSSPSFKNLHN